MKLNRLGNHYIKNKICHIKKLCQNTNKILGNDKGVAMFTTLCLTVKNLVKFR